MNSTEFEFIPLNAEEFSDELSWEDERGRGRSTRAFARPPARQSARRATPPATARPRPRPRPPQRTPQRPSPRRPWPAGGAGFDTPAEPCACPAHGSEYVRWVQSALNRIDNNRLPVDGKMGPATRSALRAFQTRQGLPADGIAGPDTEQALRDAQRPADAAAPPAEEGELFEFETLEFESPGGMPTLRLGSRGTAVTDLQRRLGAAGFSAGAADGIFGSRTDAAVRSFQRARGLGVDGVVGPLTWAALFGAAPSPSPAPAPSPPPAPNTLPAAWSNGPVDAPTWLPAKRTHNAITCGATAIPAHLQPESVTRGWTPRTQAIANLIRGPLFGWRNVEGGATGSQTGHVSASYHYCGRAIDAFPPGVAWDTRATGAGLAAGWRLANWAAHNAAALSVSQVIFYDLIWTADRGGWRAYSNPTGSTNSLQHRDHVHISVY